MNEDPITPAVSGMTKKLGPLPVYAYAVIIVGVSYGVYMWKRRTGAAVSPVATVTDIGSGISSAGPMPGTNDYSGSVTPAAKAPAASVTNAQWAKNTADGMIANGSNPSDVNNALAAYLTGSPLSSVQQSIVNTALRTYGNPPEGVTQVNGPGTYTGYMRDDSTGAVFGIGADGSRTWLTAAQYALLGNPALTSTVAPSYRAYARDEAGRVYGINSNTGERVWLSAAEYAALGRPPITINFTGHNLAEPVGTAGHKYVVKAGDTLASIAQANYGDSNTSRLEAANPGVVLSPGITITVP